jgi:hypothetical protein
MKAQGRGRVILPFIRNLGTRWRLVINVTLQPLYP